LAVDSDVGILIETGVGFHARFGLRTAFEDRIIMPEETHAPFEGFEGMVVFEGVSLSLRLFDELAVRYAGFRPMGREMVGVEFEESQTEARRADDDALFVVLAFFSCVHGAP